MLEKDLEARLRLGVKRNGGMLVKMVPAGVAGVPDRLVLWPGGVIELVELKTNSGRLRPIQRVWHDRAAMMGTVVVVLHGPTEVDAYLRDHQPKEPK